MSFANGVQMRQHANDVISFEPADQQERQQQQWHLSCHLFARELIYVKIWGYNTAKCMCSQPIFQGEQKKKESSNND